MIAHRGRHRARRVSRNGVEPGSARRKPDSVHRAYVRDTGGPRRRVTRGLAGRIVRPGEGRGPGRTVLERALCSVAAMPGDRWVFLRGWWLPLGLWGQNAPSDPESHLESRGP